MTNKDAKNPLSTLLAGSIADINLEKLAALLKPFVLIDGVTGELAFLPPFGKRDNTEKLEIVLLAAKARALLLEGHTDSTSPSSIIALQIMPEGSVKTGLRGLLGSRIKQDKGKGYFVPNYRIDELAETLAK